MMVPREHGIARIEQAAAQQVRALAQLREARDPGEVLSQQQRCVRLTRAQRHLTQARRLLDDARTMAHADTRLMALLDGHLERLTRLANEVGQVVAPEQRDDGPECEPLP